MREHSSFERIADQLTGRETHSIQAKQRPSGERSCPGASTPLPAAHTPLAGRRPSWAGGVNQEPGGCARGTWLKTPTGPGPGAPRAASGVTALLGCGPGVRQTRKASLHSATVSLHQALLSSSGHHPQRTHTAAPGPKPTPARGEPQPARLGPRPGGDQTSTSSCRLSALSTLSLGGAAAT